MKILMLLVLVVFSFVMQAGYELKHPFYPVTTTSEQKTYGMMLSGLAMVAYMARRRLRS